MRLKSLARKILKRNIFKKIDRVLYRQKNQNISRCYIRLRNIQRGLGNKGTFVSFEESLLWTLDWIKCFPDNYDVIVGVPKSGLLVASIIATKLGLPLSTPDLFADGKYWISSRIEDTIGKKSVNEFQKILLVDDCLRHEKTIKEPEQIMSSANPKIKITKAALLVSKKAAGYVDIHI